MMNRSQGLKKKRTSRTAKKIKKKSPRLRRHLFLTAGVLIALLLIGYIGRLGWEARERFGSKKWELPARVYARPLELYPGLAMNEASLMKELSLLSYRPADRIAVPGSFSRKGGRVTLYSRPFAFPDGHEPSKKIRLTIANGRIRSLSDIETGEQLSIARLDPALIGSFYPTHHQDRLWVRFSEAPPLLIQTIMAVEDRDFYEHYGIKPLSILRALKANIMAGKTVQGGSTLTQQLVKNLFLSREKSLRRKIEEAAMALSLEFFYTKDQIFEAYINEVYLAQDGNRAIHGFGMASRFYFGRSLEDLGAGETALLVGMLKGPSVYDPRKNPDRALARRNQVLKMMARQKLIRPGEANLAMKTRLDILARPPSGNSPFPAFMELVKRQLLLEYEEKDLRSEGLRIFSTLDPQVQMALEASVTTELNAIESGRGLPKNSLEIAAVVTSTSANEVVAMMGGRLPGDPGFNRVLDARRPIGSLVKPVIYLSALMRPQHYTLVTPLNDGPVEIKAAGSVWSPKNYDRRHHGIVPLYEALAQSYNVAAVRLGMDIGLATVFDTLNRLGVEGDFPAYPSALLGALEMSPIEVTQMYQTLASGGFYSPIQSIQAVYRSDGELLQRYPLTVRENIDPGAVYLLNTALQAVATDGTARSLDQGLVRRLTPAGKTGTTNDMRDSWFAGFTGDRVAAVWIGRDDNTPCGLSGATGALRVWGKIMSRIAAAPLTLTPPENVAAIAVDPVTGMRAEPACPGAVSVPFIRGSEPRETVACRQRIPKRTAESPAAPPQRRSRSGPDNLLNWFKELF
ncbi:penicillin-binding protein 1B [Desulfococcus multivorans]|uniref:Penicillin-binding protein 1B n=1 Tax=Desulfococcus multivorans DSM 2059 TaxID=1121405 RepID=S7VA52_DESML|nr:penicillin-binding protein 1B [Desulfococcus multivorans]EPR41353.1 penicillin-binding protein 1B [Desulfococcus multivorans DSM 2059]SJZ72012.1 penicillin-binding protein 1B [Desulfococcus multivorans DSM 2059]